MENYEMKNKKIKNYIVDKKNGKYVGILDKNNNIFNIKGCYFGTIERKCKKPFLLFFLIIITLFLILLVSLIFWKSYDNKIKVYQIDNEKQWNVKTNLDIFNNPKYGGKKIIAPSDTGEYKFIVQNKTKKDIQINLLLEDINLQQINMKYKLKQENKYIAGSDDNWESIESIKITNIKINPKQSVLYTLEWKWEDRIYDNIVNEIGNYTLQIIIKGY